ncbi:MAG: hypothetical protein BWX86_02735 [Verrucomicrobia bacterium ADurb.Bin122]|nr:MAG: hypothetical protein BWX86_02735 [Verrucomicrobia bacterium ADurb.Bin122]
MHMISKYITRAVLMTAFFALFLVTPAVRAAESSFGQNVGTITLMDSLDSDDAKQVVLRAVASRRLELRESTDGKIVAYHARGSNTLTLTVTYDDKKIEFFAVGTSRKGGLPMGWIENIKKDVNVFLVQQLAMKK